MQWKEIEKFLKDDEPFMQLLEYYDRTGKLPTKKLLRSFTIKQANFEKLKSAAAKRGTTMSRLLDEMIEKM
jgi:hypothetical protein